MAKRTTKKKSHSTTKKKTSQKPSLSSKEIKVEKILIENFVSLQKVMTNLSFKFDNLTNQISKLLELFEISAKALAKKEFETESQSIEDKKVLEKMDRLLDQNKTIARGLTLIHEKEGEQPQNPQKMQQPFPPKPQVNNEQYQRSSFSKPEIDSSTDTPPKPKAFERFK